MGDKFYIIIKGKISVLIPGKKKVEENKETVEKETDEFHYCSAEVKDKLSCFFEFIALGNTLIK